MSTPITRTRIELSESERLRLADIIRTLFLRYVEPRFKAVEEKIETIESLIRQTNGFSDLPEVSQKDLARQLQLNDRTFRRWREQGLIGGQRVKGRHGVWYTPEEAHQIRDLVARGGLRLKDS